MQRPNMNTYKIIFSRFIDGECRPGDALHYTLISAPNEYQAVFHHGQTNGVAFPEQNVEDVIREVVKV